MADLATAVSSASTDGEIVLCEGEHSGSGLVLPQGVSVLGLGGSTATFVRGVQGNTVFVLNDEARMEGLTGGTGRPASSKTEGGGILVGSGHLELEDVVVSDCEAGRGGGIYLGVGSSLDAVDVVVENNRGVSSLISEGGGLYMDESTMLTSATRPPRCKREAFVQTRRTSRAGRSGTTTATTLVTAYTGTAICCSPAWTSSATRPDCPAAGCTSPGTW